MRIKDIPLAVLIKAVKENMQTDGTEIIDQASMGAVIIATRDTFKGESLAAYIDGFSTGLKAA